MKPSTKKTPAKPAKQKAKAAPAPASRREMSPEAIDQIWRADAAMQRTAALDRAEPGNRFR